MSEDLKVINRQLGEAQVNLPQNTGGEKLAQAHGMLLQVAGNAVDNGMSLDEANRGVTDALSGRSLSPTKNPFMSKSAAAYTKAYQGAQVSLLSTQASVQMKQAATQSLQPENIANGVGYFETMTKSIMEGTIQNADPSIQPMLALQMQKQAIVSGSAVVDGVNTHTREVNQNNYVDVSKAGQDDAIEAIYSGDEVRVQEAIEQQKINSENFLQLGVDPVKVEKINKAFNDSIVVAGYGSQYYQSQQTGTSSQFLSDLAENKDGLGHEDHQMVIAEVSKLNAQHDRLVSKSISETNAKYNLALTTSGTLTPDQIDSARQELPAGDFINLQIKQFKIQQQFDKRNDGIKRLIDANAAGDVAGAAAAPAQAKDDYYNMLVDSYTAVNNGVKPTLNDKADIVMSNSKTAIPAFDKEMSANLNGGSNEQALDAAIAYTKMGGAEDELIINKVLNISDEDAALAMRIATNYSISGESEENDPVGEARKAFQNKDSEVVKAQVKSWDKNYGNGKDGPANSLEAFSDIFGGDNDVNAASGSFALFKKTFSNKAAIPGIKQDEALTLTKRALQNNMGQSAYTADPREVAIHPIEKEMKSSDVGSYINNNVKLGLHGILNNVKRAREASLKLEPNKLELAKLEKQAADIYSSGKTPDTDMLSKIQNLNADVHAAQFYMQRVDSMPAAPEGSDFNPEIFRNNQIALISGDPGNIGDGIIGSVMVGNKYSSEVYLKSSIRTGLSKGGDSSYVYSYKDQDGIEWPLMDPYNPSLMATASFPDLAKGAPAVAKMMATQTIIESQEALASAQFDRENKYDPAGILKVSTGLDVSAATKEEKRREGRDVAEKGASKKSREELRKIKESLGFNDATTPALSQKSIGTLRLESEVAKLANGSFISPKE